MFKKNLLLSLVMLAGSAQASVTQPPVTQGSVTIENHELMYTAALDKNGQIDYSKSAYYVEFVHSTAGTVKINLPPKGHAVTHTGPTTGYTSIKIRQSNGALYANCKATPSLTGPNLTVNVHKGDCIYINHS